MDKTGHSSPRHAIMAELPRSPNTSDKRAQYLRKLVEQMLQHKTCYLSRCFKGSNGRTLEYCKYGFPFTVPEVEERIDDDNVRYLYTRRHNEDALVVPYNPEITILWGTSRSIQRVSTLGFQQYLAKYISKPEPSINIQLPENCSELRRYLRMRVIGSVEALEVLMGFHQNQMFRQVIFLHTEMQPNQRMLKPQKILQTLDDNDEDIYLQTKLETYLQRPSRLAPLTYPEFYQWWHPSTSPESSRFTPNTCSDKQPISAIGSKGTDDFTVYMTVKRVHDMAFNKLLTLLSTSSTQVKTSHDLLALTGSLELYELPAQVITVLNSHYRDKGFEPLPQNLHLCFERPSELLATNIARTIDWQGLDFITGLKSKHWLMDHRLRTEVVEILTQCPPGTILTTDDGHHWIRRARMAITRHRYISSVGDNQENYYQQKYLLHTPLMPQSTVIQSPPQSWVSLCASEGMCDTHLDALSCLQSAVTRGFHVDAIRNLVELYIEHGFLQLDEADIFLADIPILGEKNEPTGRVTDQMLTDPQSDPGDLIKPSITVSLNTLIDTFTESQLRAYRLIEDKITNHNQISAAVVGPAGTGKSYLLKAVIELAKTRSLVVGKLAPSGVAAYLIGGTTIHNFFGLDIEGNSSLENGSTQIAKLRQTDRHADY